MFENSNFTNLLLLRLYIIYMVGKRVIAKRRGKRRPNRRRIATNSLPTVGVGLLRLIRNFMFYPKQLSGDKTSTSWLDALVKYGAVAMKLFLAVVTYTEGVGAVMAPYCSVQCLSIGPEDLVWSSAIKEVRRLTVFDKDGKTVDIVCPTLDYRQARVRSMTVKVTPSSELAKRGGRICVAVVPLTLKEAEKIVDGRIPIQQLDFSLLVQTPGAIVKPASRAITHTWRPKSSDLGKEFLECGTTTTPTYAQQSPSKGLPVCMVYFGYQDMACSKPDASQMYAPEEAMFNVDISGMVDLREYGTSYIRKAPTCVFSSDNIGVVHPDRLIPADFPLSCFSQRNGLTYLDDVFVTDEIKLSCREQDACPASSSSSIVTGFERLTALSD